MYKSLLMVTLFSLPLSAMDKPTIAKNAGLAAGAALLFTKCTPIGIVAGPGGHATCVGLGAAYGVALAYVAANTPKPSTPKESK